MYPLKSKIGFKFRAGYGITGYGGLVYIYTLPELLQWLTYTPLGQNTLGKTTLGI